VVRSIHDDADVLVWLLEPKKITDDEFKFGEKLLQAQKPFCLAINKIDSLKDNQVLAQINSQLKQKFGEKVVIFEISARAKTGLDDLKKWIVNSLPVSPPYFPIDQMTNRWERFYVSELIREKIFAHYHQEIPHACAVVVDEFVEKKDRKDLIRVIIYTETDGQKNILVGARGQGIKALGQSARREIEERLDRPVYLELIVKVRKNWRKDTDFVHKLLEING
jgi:GTP-binding protein Era